jgi:hypothetical protein
MILGEIKAVVMHGRCFARCLGTGGRHSVVALVRERVVVVRDSAWSAAACCRFVFLDRSSVSVKQSAGEPAHSMRFATFGAADVAHFQHVRAAVRRLVLAMQILQYATNERNSVWPKSTSD